MRSQAVKVPVIGPIAIECDFWQEDDGWKGFCQHLMISVQDVGFEKTKKDMESALEAHIKSVLRLPTDEITGG